MRYNSIRLSKFGEHSPDKRLRRILNMKAFRPGQIPVASEFVELPPIARGAKPKKTTVDIHQSASDYLTLKAEGEKIEKRLALLRKDIEPELAKLPDGKLFVDGFDRYLHLVDCEKTTFDLEGAEKRKNVARLIEPYVVTKRTLDLKAALKHIDVETLNPFIEVSPYTALKTPKCKEDEGKE